MGGWFFEACETYEDEIVDDALAALRYAFKAAQAPYQLPAGPEVIAVAPATLTVAAGDWITLTAQADDTRSYGGFHGSDPAQPVQAARATLDLPPWLSDSVQWPVLPADSRFDQPQEALVLEMQTACWATGRHLLYLQAQDQAGDWGTPSAAWVEVTAGAEFLLELASPPAIDAGVPASYTLTLTNTSPIADSFTLAAEPGAWAFDLPTQPIGPLMPGATTQVTFTATAPSGVEQRDPARIVVTSTAPSGHCLDAYLRLPVVPQPRRYHFPFLPGQSLTP